MAPLAQVNVKVMVTPAWRLGAPLLLALALVAPARAQYAFQQIAPNFIDVSTLPGAIAGPNGDDVLSATLTFPGGFAFPFYGSNRTQFKISTNGFLTFQTTHASSTASNQNLPSTTDPDAVVAPLWDDLVLPTTTPTPVGTTHYYLDDRGTPVDFSDDRVIVQWTNAYFFGASVPQPRQSFQAHLYANGDIQFHYGQLDSPQTDYTIGIENNDGTSAVNVYYGATNPTPGTGTPASTAYGFRIFIDVPVSPPNCATQTSPPDGATNVPYGSTTLTWTPPATGPTVQGYFLDVGTTAGGGEILAGLDVGNVTSFNAIGLEPGATYFWRVRPYNGVGAASGCSIFSFTTAGPVTSFPYLEAFTDPTFPPPNWTRFSNGNGTAQQWVRVSTAPIFAQSRFEDVTTGVAQDYLASPALASPSGGLGLTFKMWQSFGSNFGSVYKVLVSTDDQAEIADYVEVASWDEASPCPGAAAPPPTTTPAEPNCAISLAAYAGQTIYVAFLHQNDNGDNFNLDDVRFAEIPNQPVFSINPSGTVDFGTAGACSTRPEATQSFTISNSGAGTLVVTGVSFTSGSSASYTITSAPAFPIALAAGQSTTITVRFAPGVGDSGTQTGQLEVTYNTGSGAQTFTVDLTGTANPANFAFGKDAGYLYRNSVEACAASSPLPSPGTALVPFNDHVKITALTGGDFDDGYFDVPAAALDALIAGGSFRMFGRTAESLRITTNGNIYLSTGAPYGAAADRTITLPTISPGGVIAVAGMDLDLDPVDYAADDDGIGGTPGIWLGPADVDGDGDDELVVTWYHAYDFASPSLPNPAARYFTFQAILSDAGDQPNREDRVEIRFIDGLDPNGIPFRLNTNSTVSTPSMENDVVVGLSNAQGTAAAEYHENASGGPLYGSNLGVRFVAEVQAVADDAVAGWRMMGAPVEDFTVDRLADLNLVVGVAGEYPAFPQGNVRIDYDGIDWVLATSQSQTLVPGQGFMWYLFDAASTPDSTVFGPGTSQSYPLPMELEGTGKAVSLVAGNYPIPLHSDGKKWNLIANPFRESLDLTGLASWAIDGTLASAVGEIWQPLSTSPPFGTYVLTTDPQVGNVITAWQGLVVENESAVALAVPATAQTTGGTFVGRGGGSPLAEDVRVVAFQLAAGEEGGPVLDRAAILYFHPEAGVGWDLWDVTKLAPLSETYAAIAFGGERDGGAVAKAQESRPFESGPFEVPIQLDAVGMGGTLTLSWPSVVNVPEAWALTLTDLATGAVVNLREATGYTFEVEPAAQSPRGEGRFVPAIGALARGADRFVLRVEGTATGTEPGQDLPTAFALEGAYPNPFSGAATVRYAVPEAAHVTVEVFDLLGRRVVTLVDGEASPGYHTTRWVSDGLASGVYVVRMRSDSGFAQSRRVTVLK